MSETSSFSGFPPESLRFLDELADNNNRDWFQAHKQDYTSFVLGPAQAFVAALGERLQTISEGIAYDTRTSGSGSILRIYRDVRFSKDKSPYYTYMRFVLWEGSRKKMENPSFMIGVDPNGAAIYSGLHVFPKPMLAAYRDAVVDEQLGAELEAALVSVQAAGKYQIGGEHYKRVPRGYDPEHKRADLLRYNGLHARSPSIDPAVIITPQLVDACFEHCHNMIPIHQWLVKVAQ